MKIAVVCLASRTGGGLTILKDLFQYAGMSGAHEWLFVLSDQELGSHGTHIGVVQAAPNYSGLGSRLRAEMTTARRAVDAFDPDIVLSLQNTDTLARGRRPLAIYMHQPLPYSDVRFSFFRRAERALAVRQHILGRWIRWSIRRSAVTFVQTSWVARAVQEQCPGANVVQTGYELPTQLGVEVPLRSDTECLVYPASGVLYKDHKTLHEAMKIWHSSGPEVPRVVLTVTQHAFDALVDGLAAGEASWYEFVGFIDRLDLEKIYLKSILVFPSYVETLGLPLYEAQAAGCRIVSANTPPSREALEGYAGAHFFAPRSPEDLARALKEAWDLRCEACARRTEWPVELSAGRPWDLLLAGLGQIVDGVASQVGRTNDA